MLSVVDPTRICTATLAGGFGVHLFLPENFTEIEFRHLRAGVANSSRDAVVQTTRRAGSEQGNLQS